MKVGISPTLAQPERVGLDLPSTPQKAALGGLPAVAQAVQSSPAWNAWVQAQQAAGEGNPEARQRANDALAVLRADPSFARYEVLLNDQQAQTARKELRQSKGAVATKLSERIQLSEAAAQEARDRLGLIEAGARFDAIPNGRTLAQQRFNLRTAIDESQQSYNAADAAAKRGFAQHQQKLITNAGAQRGFGSGVDILAFGNKKKPQTDDVTELGNAKDQARKRLDETKQAMAAFDQTAPAGLIDAMTGLDQAQARWKMASAKLNLVEARLGPTGTHYTKGTAREAALKREQAAIADLAEADGLTALAMRGDPLSADVRGQAFVADPGRMAQDWAQKVSAQFGLKAQSLAPAKLRDLVERSQSLRPEFADGQNAQERERVVAAVLKRFDEESKTHPLTQYKLGVGSYSYGMLPGEHGGGRGDGLTYWLEDDSGKVVALIDGQVAADSSTADRYDSVQAFRDHNPLPGFDSALAILDPQTARMEGERIVLAVQTGGAHNEGAFERFTRKHPNWITAMTVVGTIATVATGPLLGMVGRQGTTALMLMQAGIATSSTAFTAAQLVQQARQEHARGQRFSGETVMMGIMATSSLASMLALSAAYKAGKSPSGAWPKVAQWANRASWAGFIPVAADLDKLVTQNHGKGFAEGEQQSLWTNVLLSTIPPAGGEVARKMVQTHQARRQAPPAPLAPVMPTRTVQVGPFGLPKEIPDFRAAGYFDAIPRDAHWADMGLGALRPLSLAPGVANAHRLAEDEAAVPPGLEASGTAPRRPSVFDAPEHGTRPVVHVSDGRVPTSGALPRHSPSTSASALASSIGFQPDNPLSLHAFRTGRDARSQAESEARLNALDMTPTQQQVAARKRARLRRRDGLAARHAHQAEATVSDLFSGKRARYAPRGPEPSEPVSAVLPLARASGDGMQGRSLGRYERAEPARQHLNAVNSSRYSEGGDLDGSMDVFHVRVHSTPPPDPPRPEPFVLRVLKEHWRELGMNEPSAPLHRIDLGVLMDRQAGPFDPVEYAETLRQAFNRASDEALGVELYAFESRRPTNKEMRQLQKLAEELDTSVHLLSKDRNATSPLYTHFESTPHAAVVRQLLRHPFEDEHPDAMILMAVAQDIDDLRFRTNAHEGKLKIYQDRIRPQLLDVVAIARSDSSMAQEAYELLLFMYPEFDAGQPAAGPVSPLRALLAKRRYSREEVLDMIERSAGEEKAVVLRGDRLQAPTRWLGQDPLLGELIQEVQTYVEAEQGIVRDDTRDTQSRPNLLNPYSGEFYRAVLEGDIAAIWIGLGLGNTREVSAGLPLASAGFVLHGTRAIEAASMARTIGALEPIDLWAEVSLGDKDIQANVRMWEAELDEQMALAEQDLEASRTELEAARERGDPAQTITAMEAQVQANAARLGAQRERVPRAKEKLAQRLATVTEESLQFLNNFAKLVKDAIGIKVKVNLSSVVSHEPAYQMLYQVLISPNGPFAHLPLVEREYFAAQLAEQMTYLPSIGAFNTRLIKSVWDWLNGNTEMPFSNATRDVFGDESVEDALTRPDLGRFGRPGSPYFDTEQGDQRVRASDPLDRIEQLLDVASISNPVAQNLEHWVEHVRAWEQVFGPLTNADLPDYFVEAYVDGHRRVQLTMPRDVLAEKMAAMAQWIKTLTPPDGVEPNYRGVSFINRKVKDKIEESQGTPLEQGLLEAATQWLHVEEGSDGAFRVARTNQAQASQDALSSATLRYAPVPVNELRVPMPGSLNERLAAWAQAHGVPVLPIRMAEFSVIGRGERRSSVISRSSAAGTRTEVWMPPPDVHRSNDDRRLADRQRYSLLRPSLRRPDWSGFDAETGMIWRAEADQWMEDMREWSTMVPFRVDFKPPPPMPRISEFKKIRQLQLGLDGWWSYRLAPEEAVRAWKAKFVPEVTKLAAEQSALDRGADAPAEVLARRVHIEEAVMLAVTSGIDERVRTAAEELNALNGLKAYVAWRAIGGRTSVKLEGDAAFRHGPLQTVWPFSSAAVMRHAELQAQQLPLAQPGMMQLPGILVERAVASPQVGDAVFFRALSGDAEAIDVFNAELRRTAEQFESNPSGWWSGQSMVEPAPAKPQYASPKAQPRPRLSQALPHEAIAQHVNDVLQSLGIIAGAQPRVQRTRRGFGDYAWNVSALAREQRTDGAQLAERIAESFNAQPEACRLVRAQAQGRYVNFTFTDEALTAWLVRSGEPGLGVPSIAEPRSVAADYMSPNNAKELHAGHLRSTGLGDIQTRILEFLGYRVIRQNHIGDWGTPFGMLLARLKQRGMADASGLDVPQLGELYREAKQQFDSNTEFHAQALRLVAELQGGNMRLRRIWQQLVDVSLDHIDDICRRLGISLKRSDVRGESAYNDDLPRIVAELEAKGLVVESEGAKVAFPKGFLNPFGQPRAMLIEKSGGGFLYATTDVAAARYRAQVLKVNRVEIWADRRQGEHFAQAFELTYEAGFAPRTVVLRHVPFGTMLDHNYRPFATRSGGTIKLTDLLDEGLARAKRYLAKRVAEKNAVLADMGIEPRQVDEATMEQTAQELAKAIIRYADASRVRTKDYRFSVDNMLDFDQSRITDILYANLRARRLLQRARELEPDTSSEGLAPVPVQGRSAAEHGLTAHLMGFGEVLHNAADEAAAHQLCKYLEELTARFSRFYTESAVLGTEKRPVSAEDRERRLLLVERTERTMRQALEFMGVDVDQVGVL